MTVSLSQLLEDSFQIAWEYLERSGELGDGASASRFLSDVIETMISRGQRSRLALSNRAIRAYQRFRSSGDAGSEPVRSSALKRPIGAPQDQESRNVSKRRRSRRPDGKEAFGLDRGGAGRTRGSPER